MNPNIRVESSKLGIAKNTRAIVVWSKVSTRHHVTGSKLQNSVAASLRDVRRLIQCLCLHRDEGLSRSKRAPAGLQR